MWRSDIEPLGAAQGWSFRIVAGTIKEPCRHYLLRRRFILRSGDDALLQEKTDQRRHMLADAGLIYEEVGQRVVVSYWSAPRVMGIQTPATIAPGHFVESAATPPFGLEGPQLLKAALP